MGVGGVDMNQIFFCKLNENKINLLRNIYSVSQIQCWWMESLSLFNLESWLLEIQLKLFLTDHNFFVLAVNDFISLKKNFNYVPHEL